MLQKSFIPFAIPLKFMVFSFIRIVHLNPFINCDKGYIIHITTFYYIRSGNRLRDLNNILFTIGN